MQTLKVVPAASPLPITAKSLSLSVHQPVTPLFGEGEESFSDEDEDDSRSNIKGVCVVL